MTLRAVHTKQPDLKGKGFFLSVMLILFGNALIVGLLLVGLFGRTPTLKEYGLNLFNETKEAWIFIVFYGKQVHHLIQTWTR